MSFRDDLSNIKRWYRGALKYADSIRDISKIGSERVANALVGHTPYLFNKMFFADMLALSEVEKRFARTIGVYAAGSAFLPAAGYGYKQHQLYTAQTVFESQGYRVPTTEIDANDIVVYIKVAKLGDLRTSYRYSVSEPVVTVIGTYGFPHITPVSSINQYLSASFCSRMAEGRFIGEGELEMKLAGDKYDNKYVITSLAFFGKQTADSTQREQLFNCAAVYPTVAEGAYLSNSKVQNYVNTMDNNFSTNLLEIGRDFYVPITLFPFTLNDGIERGSGNTYVMPGATPPRDFNSANSTANLYTFTPWAFGAGYYIVNDTCRPLCESDEYKSLTYNLDNSSMVARCLQQINMTGSGALIPPIGRANVHYVDTTNSSADYISVTNDSSAALCPDGIFRVGNRSQYTVTTWDSLDDIKQYFDDWGVRSTFDETIARSGVLPPVSDDFDETSPSGGNSGKIPDLPSEGLPDTPTQSIPNDPQNRIDDFNIENPNITAANLCNSYVYDFLNVKKLFNWFCDSSYFKNQSELFADKLSAVMGLMQYPFDLVTHDPAHVTAVDKTTIVSVTGDVQGHTLDNGYNCIVSGGSIEYLSYYGNFADYNSCSYSVYVPFGGLVEIPAHAVVNRRLTLTYGIDLTTGRATAVLKSYALGDEKLGALVKLIPCQLGNSIPVQASNSAQKEVASAMAGVSLLGNIIGTVSNFAGGNVVGGISSALGTVNALGSSLDSGRVSFSASGSLTPSTGFMLPLTPFLCIVRDKMVNAQNRAFYLGTPTQIYTRLGDLPHSNNLTVVQGVLIDIPEATESERQEINALLNSGVFL